jgi:hypothetical protein
MGTRLILPLMMFGKLRNHWHIEGEFVRKKTKVGEAVYKGGKKKGQKYPVYDWLPDLKPQKVLTGYDGTFTRGKNKGKPKPVFETKNLPYMSTGYFPSANAIYMNTPHGGRRLNDMAEAKLKEWQDWTKRWADGRWTCQKVGTKVVAEMVFYFPDEKIRDTHNAKKLLLDSLEGIIHENDMWILDRTLDFAIDPDFPRIEIDFFTL